MPTINYILYGINPIQLSRQHVRRCGAIIRKYSTMRSIPGHTNELPALALIRCLFETATLASTLIAFDIPRTQSSAAHCHTFLATVHPYIYRS
jgi:hypothetical protein